MTFGGDLLSQKLIVALTGASGQTYGIHLLQAAHSLDIETHLVISRAAQLTITQETDYAGGEVEALADVVYPPGNVGAAIASGSFPVAGMAIVPCSIKTLSAVAHSYSSDLISRAADVQLKEGRPLLLAVRETPLHLGHLRLLLQAAEAGAIIFPPLPAFYQRPRSIDEMVDATVGRMLARLGFANALYNSWQGL